MANMREEKVDTVEHHETNSYRIAVLRGEEIDRLERVVKQQRSVISDLEGLVDGKLEAEKEELLVEGKLLETDIKLLRREVMRSQSIEQDGQRLISKGNAKISRLEGELSTWKKLWMKEREYRHNLSDRVDVATRGVRALSDKDPWERWPMKEANEEE